MARPSVFSREMIANAARRLAADMGPLELSITALGEALGAPTGSIYHRFSSKDELLATLWMDAVETFQRALLAEAERTTDAGSLAGFVVRWCREHPMLAKILALYRREEWLGERLSEATRARASSLNDPAKRLVRERACAWLGEASKEALEQTTLVIATIPMAAVQPYLERDEPVPEWLERVVKRAAQAAIEEASACR